MAGGASGAASLMGAGSGMLASQFGLIKSVLEGGIRRARIKVSWLEGKKPCSVEIVEYLTDPKRVDMALQMPTGAVGSTGATGSTGSTGAKASTGAIK